MSKKLLFGRTKKILLFVTLLFGVAASGVFGQSTGDIAIVGFNSDGHDDFALTSFINISSGTTLYFTDRPWDGTSFTGGEGTYSYTVPEEGLDAGEVITINPSTETSSNGGSVTSISGSFDLTNTGDELYIYLGSDPDTPTTFLFAVSNDNSWDANELTSTGLTDGSTALSDFGGSINDNAEYSGVREGTVSTLKSEIQKVGSEWTTSDGNNDQSISFNTNSFTVLDPPTVAFTSSSISAGEDQSIATVGVELVEDNSTAVNVDVVFLGSSSSASVGDIDNYSTVTASFANDEDSGTERSIPVNLDNDSNFEGTETAVFQLQNNTAGTIIEPETVTLTINDDDIPDVVINEFLADPPGSQSNDLEGDANGDGTRSRDDDEFVEIVNNEATDIDISGWQLSDDVGNTTRHIFPSGTVLPAGRAIVVFGGGDPTGNFGGAIVQITSSLNLTNSGGNVTLLDNEGNIIQDISYGGSGEPNADNDESVTRNEDITGSFEGHTSADSEDDGSAYSPGTKIDGTPFGSDHAIAIRGTEGWRMISSPVQGASFSDVLSEFWMQGVNNSDDPGGNATLYSWDESGGGTFSAPGNMSENLTPGKGYIVYFFEDDEFNTPGIQGGFPKIIDTEKSENGGPVTVTVSATDVGGKTDIDGEEGWNLLGNPFDTDISVTAVLDELGSVNSSVNGSIYVWDHEADNGNGDWITLNDGDRIAPFQAFFVRFTSAFTAENASFDKSELEANEGKEFYKDVNENFTFDLELHGEQYFDTYSLEFTDDGSTELDRYDAYKLFSLNPNSINLYSTLNNNRLQKNVLPRELESNLEIPLSFDASGRTSLTYQWGSFDNIPDEWDIILIDNELNREVDLRSNDEYEFTIEADSEVNDLASSSNSNNLLKTAKQDDGEPRFTLAVQPQIAGSDESEIPESVKLNPNYPNPFNPSTTVSFELTEDSEVTLSIWNMIGQKVATLVEGVVEAGTHRQTWNASNMPSGMYIARLEVGGEVFIRKMTLIK